MAVVEETIAPALQPDVDAALAWYNAQESDEFKVTGILDPDRALEQSGTRELRLVLCGGDRCEQRSFRVTATGDDYDVAFLNDASSQEPNGVAQAELDPPPGAMKGWLDRVLSQHAFVVLVFYRGFW